MPRVTASEDKGRLRDHTKYIPEEVGREIQIEINFGGLDD
jgi:hypothetical protein